MKKKFKKLNRGLLLGGLAIIMTVCYVVVDNLTFNKNKSVIEQTAKNYVDEIFKANIVKDYDQPNAASNLTKSITDVLEKTWTNHDIQTTASLNSGYDSKSSMLTQLGEGYNGISTSLDNPDDSVDYAAGIYDISATITKMTIKKYGPNSAMVDIDLNYTMYSSGIGYYLTPGSIQYIFPDETGLPFEESDPKFKEINDTLANRTKCIKLTCTSSYSILMTKEKDSWKVYGASNSFYSSPNTTIVDFDAASKKPVEKDGKEDISDEHSN